MHSEHVVFTIGCLQFLPLKAGRGESTLVHWYIYTHGQSLSAIIMKQNGTKQMQMLPGWASTSPLDRSGKPTGHGRMLRQAVDGDEQ